MTAAKWSQARFEQLWAYCMRQGSACAMEPFLHQDVVLLADEGKMIHTGRQEAVAYLSELISDLAFLETKAVIYRAHALDDQWSILYGLIQAEDIVLRFTIVVQAQEQTLFMHYFHFAKSLAQITEEASACAIFDQIAQMRRLELDKRQEALRESEAIYRFVLEATSDLILDIDLDSRQIHLDCDKMMALFEVPLSPKPSILEVYEKLFNVILPADQALFQQKFGLEGAALSALGQGDMLSEEFRILNKAKGYLWLRIIMIPIKREHQMTRLVANIKNIDQQKREELRIRHQSERDPLTDLLNKGHTEACINDYLAQGRHDGVLLMIDVDNFKLVNDNLGHQAGDKVLKALGEALSGIFRASDIVGRVGGDEFVVFMKAVNERVTAAKKAKQVTEAFRQAYFAENGVFWISASVGIVMVSAAIEQFAQLWPKADQALYHQKRHGKNGWTFYEDLDAAESEVAGYAQEH